MNSKILAFCSMLAISIALSPALNGQTVTTLPLGIDFDQRVYEELFAKSDLVVVAKAMSETQDFEDDGTLSSIPELYKKYVGIGVTNFKRLLVLKGSAEDSIRLVHHTVIPLKEGDRVGGLPLIAQFSAEKQQCHLNEKTLLFTPEYILFLRIVRGDKYVLVGELETTYRSVRVISQF